MSKRLTIPLLFAFVALFLASCQSKQSASDLQKTLEDNPEILTEVMKKNPQLFMETLQKIASQMREKALEDRNKKEQEILEAAFKNPIEVEKHSEDLIIGNPNAKVIIYEYSDFQCPFCYRALETVKQVLDDYKDDVAFVYRHLPIDSIHPNARLAAKYYEAIRIEYGRKAFDFHETILKNQNKVRHGEKYFISLVKEMKLDVGKIKELVSSKRVENKIAADVASANKLGFSGTPGFVVAGVPVKGAYPYSHFKMILDRRLNGNSKDPASEMAKIK